MAAGSKTTLETSAEADAVLSVLKSAMKGARLPSSDRTCATRDPRCPEEGLALLGAYVTIESPDVRQAILDLVSTIAAARAADHLNGKE